MNFFECHKLFRSEITLLPSRQPDIVDMSHCANMEPAQTSNSKQLHNARVTVLKTVQQWLVEAQR